MKIKFLYIYVNFKEAISIGEAEIRNILTKIYPTPKPGKMKIITMHPMDLILQFGFITSIRKDNITNAAHLEHLTQYDFRERSEASQIHTSPE